jgi:hypothetical protein
MGSKAQQVNVYRGKRWAKISSGLLDQFYSFNLLILSQFPR